MNKLTNILLSLGVLLFLLSFGMKSEAMGQPDTCSAPWHHVVDVITVDGCDYMIDLCVLCAYSYPGQVKLNFYQNIGPCSSTLDPVQIAQQVITQVTTYAYLWYEYCQFNMPPCKNPEHKKQIIEINVPLCWKMKLHYKDPIDSTKNIYLSYPCGDDAYCWIKNAYCFDTHTQTVKHTIENILGYNLPPACGFEGYEITIPTEEGKESECYILHTLCNPDEK